MTTARVLLVGAHGHGRWHLENVRRLGDRGKAQLVGVCDVRPLTDEQRALAGTVPVGDELGAMLALTEPDVTIICTPIHTHVELTATATRAGSHVLLEKPPAATLADFHRLAGVVATSGRACQIGFQSLGSHALDEVRRLVADGVVGDVRGIGAAGAWVRDTSYYQRSPWAGRRRIDGTFVVDGALTNPFAHAVMTALSVDGSEREHDVRDIDVELFRANPIEADDTSCLRVTTARGTTIVVAVTLAAGEHHDPYLVVHGSVGRITLWYKLDRIRVESDGVTRTSTYGRTDLLDNLVRHIGDPAVALLVPPERTASFMRVVEAVRIAPEPVEIDRRYQQVVGDGAARRHIVDGVDEAVAASADRLQLFSESGLAWAGAQAASGASEARP